MSSFIPDLYLTHYVDMSNLAASLRETFKDDLSRVSRNINCVTVEYVTLSQVKYVVENAHRDSLSEVFDIEYSSDDSSLVMVFHRKEAAKVFVCFYEGAKYEE